MKKYGLIFSFVLVASMLLAACGGATSDDNGAVGTVMPTGSAGTGGDLSTTPTVGSELNTTPTAGSDLNVTPAPGSDLSTTPTAGSDLNATPSSGSDLNATPTVSAGTGSTDNSGSTGAIPQTGASQYVLLSNLMGMTVQGQDGQQLGNVQGVVIDRSMASGASSSTYGSGTTGGSDATSGSSTSGTDMTTTPTADAGSTTSGSTTGSDTTSGSTTGTVTGVEGSGPRVAYVLVNGINASGSSSSSNSNSNSSSNGSGSSTSGSDANNTNNSSSGSSASGKAQGNEVLIPWQAFQVKGAADSATGSMSSDAQLVLTADSSVVQNAPAFDAQAFNGQVGSEVSSYWAGPVAGIPTTGASASDNNQVLLRGQFGSVNITDAQGNNLGQVRDLVVDAQTGEIVYAVLSGGSAFQGKSFVVPMNVLGWQSGNGQGQGQGNALGDFTLNAPSDVFSQAPSINSVEDLKNNPDWNSAVQNFWNSTK